MSTETGGGWLVRWRTPNRPEEYVGADPSCHEQVVRTRFLTKVKRQVRRFKPARDAASMYFCLLDPATPLWVKGTVAAALAYFVMPIDAIPDFLPIIGLGDDAGVVAGAFAAVATHITEEHREKARAWLESDA